LWDLRFGLLLRSWSIGPRKIEKIALHPSKGKGRWIVVAAEGEELEGKRSRKQGTIVAEVWDLEQGSKVEEFRIVASEQAATSSAALSNRTNMLLPNDELPSSTMHETTLDPAAAIEALLASSTAPPTKSSTRPAEQTPSHIVPSIRSFIIGTDYSLQPTARPSVGNPDSVESREGRKDGGFFLTGGEDRKLRFWDLSRAAKSAVVSGLDIDEDIPTYRYAHVAFNRVLTELIMLNLHSQPPRIDNSPSSLPRSSSSFSTSRQFFLELFHLFSIPSDSFLISRTPLHVDRQFSATNDESASRSYNRPRYHRFAIPLCGQWR
jgi:phosphoinositide-3-kinase regulatory subunit 4